MTLGTLIKLYRRNKRVTQRDFAARIGCCPDYLSVIERDKAEPSLPLLRRIAAEIGMPAALLLTREEDWNDETARPLRQAFQERAREATGNLV